MNPWNQISADLAEPVPATLAERLRPWVRPAVFVGALAVAAGVGGPLAFLAVFLGLPMAAEKIDHRRKSV